MNLKDYFQTVFEDKFLVKMPEWEDDYLTPASQLLEKRREVFEMDQAYAAQKEEFQMKMESFQQRRNDLRKKEQELKDSFFKFDKFLKENDSKKIRAFKKATEEHEMAKQKGKDIEKLKRTIATLTFQKEKVQKKVEKNTTFWKYLEKVTEESEELHEVRDVIARFDTLLNNHNNLIKNDSHNQKTIKKERARLHKFLEEKGDEILEANNKITKLQDELEKFRSQTFKWEQKWAHILNTAAEKTLLLGQIKMTTLNLLQLANNQLRQEVEIPIEDTVAQLARIQVIMSSVEEVVAELKRRETTAIYQETHTAH
ncbi:coiled-coil domain-containing protein 42 homolog [Latimeria chalumnae]|uniref:Cilia and flagella associated protein 73 n=1 Tax=Latimeria chalumnae TaxID=7897 RepID=H3AJ91_LATCH|nr:PREDICTED: coiled-coil domain-containing protein 42B [Latimeria chalumnae]|eukprot:XP_006005487.1 PREDICTED: coiled-coil domain-containing protein 42B [Latimeria chalumnae]